MLVNILPIKYKPKDVEAVPANIILKSWTGNKLSPVGTSRMIITNPKNNKKYRVTFVVVKEELTPILGLRASEAMNLINVHKENFQEAVMHQIQEEWVNQILLGTREEIMQSFPQVFSEGVGSLPGEQHLEVDPNVKLSVNTVRRVPYLLVNDLKKELKQMEEDKLIRKINTPTP